ncbi:MAG: M1 family metallopeptidase [Oligoflexia bacterium]|nr:M1 family metallopeptidase [Oligoflexia bacterium]
MLTLLAILLPSALAPAAYAGAPHVGAPYVVTVPLSALEPAASKPVAPPVPVVRSSLRVGLVPGDETAVDLSLVLDVLVAGPVDLPVIGDALALRIATLDGRPVALPGGDGGLRSLVAPLSKGRHTLRVLGTVATPRPELSLPLVPAVRSRVDVAGDWAVHVEHAIAGADGGFDLLGASQLDLRWRAPAPLAPRPQVVRAQIVTALRVDTAGIQASARVHATVLHQPTDQLQIRLPPVDDLNIEGPAVAGFHRVGDRVIVQLSRPLDGRIDLSLSYRAPPPAPDGSPAPLAVPVTTSGHLDSGFVTVLAGDQGTVVPTAGKGLAGVPSARVPDWGRGLVPGTTVSTMAVTAASSELLLRVLDLTPVDSPATFVDQARFEVAYAAHGRALLRCRYQVRNDRSQYLGLSLPPGAVPLGVRVAGTVVQPVRDGDRLFIPLEKSVETLTGLVTFPVELSLLLDQEPWQRHGNRILSVPAVDAPVADARWEIVLPPGANSRRLVGDPTVVDAWTEGGRSLAIGRAVSLGSLSLAEEDAQDARREQSQDAWNQAYRAYQGNDFDTSRAMLERSLELNSDNQAAQDLLGNVDVLLEGGEGRDDDQARRVRAMARAKTQGLENVQSKKKAKVEASLRAGDYEAAYKDLAELSSLTEQLAVVEDKENVDQKVMLEETHRQLVQVGEKLAEASKAKQMKGEGKVAKRPAAHSPRAEPKPKPKPAPEPAPDVQTASNGMDMDMDMNIDGEMNLPQGSFGVIVDGAVSQGNAEESVALMVDDLDTELSDLGYFDAPATGAGDGGTFTGGTGYGEGSGTIQGYATGLGAGGLGVGAGGVVETTPSPTPTASPTATISSVVPVEHLGPTAMSMDPAVTAAPLSIRPPKAGQRLLLQQRLLAPGDALTVTLTYRIHSSPSPRSLP